MYFKNRVVAGNMLADKLVPKYRYENCAVIALSDGGVMVGAQIAIRLHCVLTLLLTSSITLPRENDVLASVNQEGHLTYNNMFSVGELEEMQGEYRTFIDQERQSKLHEMNSLLGDGGLIRRDLLVGHNLILVSDGLNSGFSLDVAAEFLKPLNIQKLIVATPIATVTALDRMRIIADESYVLNVMDDYISTDHYYDTNDVPDHEKIIETIQNIILQWK